MFSGNSEPYKETDFESLCYFIIEVRMQLWNKFATNITMLSMTNN